MITNYFDQLPCSFRAALVLLLVGTVEIGLSQTPTIQDCLGAIPICTEIYEESQSPQGAGNYANEVNGVTNGGISCVDAELNSIWYTFTVNQSGEFGFELTPNNLQDDYDWVLFDITNARCSDIFNLPALQVSCNAAGSGIDDGFLCNGVTGANGKTDFNLQGGGCSFPVPDQFSGRSPHNALVPVDAGNTYVLMVSNWTGSTNGYQIDFGLSRGIGIFDNLPPMVQEVNIDLNCGDKPIEVLFTENLQLGSVLSANFVITGPGGPYQALVSSQGGAVGGEYDKLFEISTDPPISMPGEYTFSIIRQSDIDLLDLCGNQLDEDYPAMSIIVDQTPVSPISFGGDTVMCVGEILTLDATDPQAEEYLWQDGSTDPTISITNSGTYAVTVSNECGETEATLAVTYANCQSCEVYIPNAITVNGDNLNDKLEIFSECELQEVELQIYDRWGDLVHAARGSSVSWDGRRQGDLLNAGVYVYQVKYKVQELGEVFDKVISGDVMLLH